LLGGLEGSCNRLEVVHDGETIHGARMPTMPLKRGDRVKLVTGGGGGFGDPLTRPVAEVADDVRGGYISAPAARDQYGVIISEIGEVDKDATEILRARRKGS
jgi:N-methylhydantoinase B